MSDTTTNETEIDYTRFEWLKPMDAAVREGVTVKTIYSRAQSGFYKSIKDSEGLKVLLSRQDSPEVKHSEYVTPPVSNREPSTNQGETSGITLHTEILTLAHEVRKLSEKVLTQGDDVVSLARELEQKKSELVIANRELEARNTAITRYRDQEAEIRRLERENERLQKDLEESQKPPGWMFWKK